MPTPWPQPWPVTTSAVPARADAAPAATAAVASTTGIPNLTRNRSSTSGLRQTRKSRADGAQPRRSFDRVEPRLGRMRRLLVANRGEIALRIFRACRAEGIETVAVAAPDDRGALHAGGVGAGVVRRGARGGARRGGRSVRRRLRLLRGLPRAAAPRRDPAPGGPPRQGRGARRA